MSVVLITSLLIARLFPEEGIFITEDMTIRFASVDEILQQNKDTSETVNAVELLQTYEEVFDSTAIKDSIRLAQVAYRKMIMRIQYPEGTKEKLPFFFRALDNLASGGIVKVLHYGDSQIEGDRISAQVRNSLQKKFGGSGPGFISVKSVVDKFSISKVVSGNWIRYAAFGIRDSLLIHRKFGMYGSYSRFTPSLPDSVLFPVATINPPDSIDSDSTKLAQAATNPTTIQALLKDTVRAWVELKPSPVSFNTAKRYQRMRMLFGNVKKPFSLKTTIGDSVISENIYHPGDEGVHEEYFTSTPRLIRLEFTSTYSPDIYGILLESTTGVLLDNVAMRGSSGVYFTRINRRQLTRQINRDPIKLIMFQFGGNSVPYITSDSHEKWYEKNLKRQLRLL
ncbi:MAG: hypothetical protein AAFO69_15795, partial [Bacteroidota bacterium]